MSSPSSSEHLARARRVFDLELAEARRVGERLDESFSQAVETIRDAVEKRAKVVLVGVGADTNCTLLATGRGPFPFSKATVVPGVNPKPLIVTCTV